MVCGSVYRWFILVLLVCIGFNCFKLLYTVIGGITGIYWFVLF